MSLREVKRKLGRPEGEGPVPARSTRTASRAFLSACSKHSSTGVLPNGRTRLRIAQHAEHVFQRGKPEADHIQLAERLKEYLREDAIATSDGGVIESSGRYPFLNREKKHAGDRSPRCKRGLELKKRCYQATSSHRGARLVGGSHQWDRSRRGPLAPAQSRSRATGCPLR
jgi:hypothetical protein